MGRQVEVWPIAGLGRGEKESFTYRLPAEYPRFSPGQLVQVPWRRQVIWALVLRSPRRPFSGKVREIVRPAPFPPLPPEFLRRVRWLADFFFDSPSHILYRAFPRRLLSFSAPPRRPRSRPPGLTAAASPTPRREIVRGGEEARWRYYQRLAEKTRGLVVCFTPHLHTALRWRHLFPRHILMHRRLTARSWRSRWLRLYTRRENIVLLTTRSGILLPHVKPSLVILDNWEAEQYKEQELRPYFDAREVVLRYWTRAAAVILGEAEAGLRSLLFTRRGWKLKKVGVRSAPPARLELTALRSPSTPHPLLTAGLMRAVREHKRVLFVLNRRGLGSRFRCPDCGLRWRCAKCGGVLTQKAGAGDSAAFFLCVNCRTRMPPTLRRPVFCPRCQSPRFGPAFWGIDSLARALRKWQSDTPVFTAPPRAWPPRFIAVLTRPSLAFVPPRFVEMGVAVLPTQDFWSIDYRAWERVWQRLIDLREKVSSEGTVWLVDNFAPPPLRDFVNRRHTWLRAELNLRRRYHLPPFTLEATVSWRGSASRAEGLKREAERQLKTCRRKLKSFPQKLVWYGPYFPLERRKRHQPRLLLRGSLRALQAAASCLPKDVIWNILPYNTLTS